MGRIQLTDVQLGLLPTEWADLECLTDSNAPADAPKKGAKGKPRAKAGSILPSKSGSTPEELFASQCRMFRLPPFEQQLLFAKEKLGRLWRFDFAWPQYKLAVEINGVNVQNVRVNGKPRLVVLGRHASIEGLRSEYEKMRAAANLGWSVLPFLQSDVKPQHAITETMRELAARGWKGSIA